MPYYQDASERLHFIESEADVDRLPQGCQPISDEAASLVIAEQKIERQLSPLEQIRALEQANADDMAKASRQAFIALALKEGAALGYTHAQLMQYNAGYRRMYELEELIKPLRAQL